MTRLHGNVAGRRKRVIVLCWYETSARTSFSTRHLLSAFADAGRTWNP